MRTPRWSILTSSLVLTLAVGCSRGLLPSEEQRDGGINNHLGDGPISWGGGGGGAGFDAGGMLPPAGGGGGGTATGICGTDAATGDATTDACLQAACCSSFTPCYADAACEACLADPGAPACSSNSKFLAFDSCWAANCDSSGGGGTTGGLCGTTESTGDPTVDACLDAACCTSFSACYSNATCQACMYDSSSAGCSSNSRFLAFDDCWTASCDSGGGGGGGGGSGVCGSDISSGDSYLDACVDALCCYEFDACYANATCAPCLANPSGAGCSSNSRFLDFDDCVYYSC